MSGAPKLIDRIIKEFLSARQRAAVKELTRCGYGREQAVRRLIHLGILVRETEDLETDLRHNTRYALRDEAKRRNE